MSSLLEDAIVKQIVEVVFTGYTVVDQYGNTQHQAPKIDSLFQQVLISHKDEVWKKLEKRIDWDDLASKMAEALDKAVRDKPMDFISYRLKNNIEEKIGTLTRRLLDDETNTKIVVKIVKLSEIEETT